MKCPTCESDKGKVIDSRDTNGGWTRRRRHLCLSCDNRWTTTEVPTGMVDELIELAKTHLAIEEAYREIFGKARGTLDKMFGVVREPGD
jgi:transcriptional regulator NrdR family protein